MRIGVVADHQRTRLMVSLSVLRAGAALLREAGRARGARRRRWRSLLAGGGGAAVAVRGAGGTVSDNSDRRTFAVAWLALLPASEALPSSAAA